MTRAVVVVPQGRGGPATLASVAAWAARRDVQVVSLAGDVLSALTLVAAGDVDVVLVRDVATLAPAVRVTGPGRPVDGDRDRPGWSPEVDPRRQPARPAWSGASS